MGGGDAEPVVDERSAADERVAAAGSASLDLGVPRPRMRLGLDAADDAEEDARLDARDAALVLVVDLLAVVVVVEHLPETSDVGRHVYGRLLYTPRGWLGSRVVSVLDSGAVGPGFKSQPRRCRISLRQTVHTHRASVRQAAKLLAALLRVARVTTGLAESNGSLPPSL